MNVLNLFPTAVGCFQYDKQLTKKELEFIRNQKTRPNDGNTTSEDHYILEKSTLKNIRKFIEDSLAKYLEEIYAPKNKVSLRITQSWLNYTEPKQYHHKHEHPNSFISGVYYPQSEPEDKITFFKSGYQQIKLPTEKYNLYNSESWWVETLPGSLYFFPSSLTHMVTLREGAGTRISLALNTFPIGYVGEDESLTGLHL